MGEMSRDVIDERSEVHCLRAILSEQDLDSVGGASGREGFRRTVPSSEKNPLPYKIGCSGDAVLNGSGVEVEESGGDEVVKTSAAVPFEVGGISQGVESSWAAMVSSILASPPGRYLAQSLGSKFEKCNVQGASEQYMCRFMPSFNANGWE